jgi:Fe-Mn family superoxide dismutase
MVIKTLKEENVTFKLPPLPYASNALEPHMSENTLNFHHGKHHMAYVNKLNDLIKGTSLEGRDLEYIIKETAGNPDLVGVFNNAAQSWNHTFFWNSMKPNGGGAPTGSIFSMIEDSFGSFDQFKAEFIEAAVTQFGSGWVWLVDDYDQLRIIKTGNADNPLTRNLKPLLTCDVWEHAYYLDYQNRRQDFVHTFLGHLVNWDFAEKNLK